MQTETETEGNESNRTTQLTINETLPPYKEISIRDKYHITYITCLIVGLGSLLPYTCLLSSSDYFQQNHKKTNNIILRMMTLFDIFNFGSIALLIPFNTIISIKTRIIICNLVTAITFLLIIKYVDSYSFSLCISCLCGTTNGVLCVSAIAYAQFFSEKLCFNLCINHYFHLIFF